MIDGYPRPQMVRGSWENLNGIWDFAFDDEGKGEAAGWHENFPEEKRDIVVPYTYETKLSGIGEEAFHPIIWYRKKVMIKKKDGNKILLHFEGSDYITKFWINGKMAGSHIGGYSRFSSDITQFVEEGENIITARVEDSESCAQPRGKQRWKKENFGCWYVQTTGIWKTVWIEEVPEYYIDKLKITSEFDEAKVKLAVKLNQAPEKGTWLECRIFLDGEEVAADIKQVSAKLAEFEISLADPSEPWKVAAWTPENPKLYDIALKLQGEGAADEVKSYFGLRKISIEGGKILLNNLPFYQRLILDQGYWEESHLTPPSDEALRKDVELILAAGYNGLRKHEKVEDERFLYYCDKYGLVVWLEMPSTYIFDEDVIRQYTAQWLAVVEQNYNHPCIITWTAFNESWGLERIFTDGEEQRFTEGIYYLTKALDPTRPVITNDGWEHTISDVLTLHDYEESGERFYQRYQDKEKIVNNEFPFNGGKYAMAKGKKYAGQPILISEYGGIAFSTETGWGYGEQVKTEEKFLERLKSITDAIKKLDYSVGFCYTQLTDVQQEVNGLYTSKREPKVNIEEVRKINIQ